MTRPLTPSNSDKAAKFFSAANQLAAEYRLEGHEYFSDLLIELVANLPSESAARFHDVLVQA